MHRARFRLALVSLTVLALVGCASDPGTGSPNGELETDPSEDPPVEIPIGPDGPELPEEVVAQLQAYGAQHEAEFGGLYVEDQGRGSFVLLFTDRLDEHAAALAEIWPRVTVRGVRFSEAELLAVLEGLDLTAMTSAGVVEPIGAGLDTMNNRVTLDVKSSDPTLELRLEAQYGGRLEVTVYPMPGPWTNASEGDGWRLLLAAEAGHAEAFTVRAATDRASWDALWAALGLGVDRPQVDLAEEVVVSFGHGIGSSCREVRLDHVVITDGVVFSVTSDPLAPRACTADLAGAAAFVVAIERDALPSDGFTLQLHESVRTCPDCGFSEQIDVDPP